MAQQCLRSHLRHRLQRKPVALGNTVKRTLSSGVVSKEWQQLLAPSIQQVNDEVMRTLSEMRSMSMPGSMKPKILLWDQAFDVVENIASSPKKHLFRPQLAILGYAGMQNTQAHLGEDCPAGVIKMAAGVELQHLFMLIHDDMMDNASFRRGEDTMQVALSRASADKSIRLLDSQSLRYLSTIVGDLLLARSVEMVTHGAVLCGASLDHVLGPIMEGVYRAGAAQFEDIVGWNGLVEMEPEPLHVLGRRALEYDSTLGRLLTDKAAFHGFIAPLLAGAALGVGGRGLEENAKLQRMCEEWGFRAGVAFQALDDLADLTCSPAETGKDQLKDIHECRLSLPLMLLWERAKEDEWVAVRDLLTLRTGTAPGIHERMVLLDLIEKYELVGNLNQFIELELLEAQKVAEKMKDDASLEVLGFGFDAFNKGLTQVKQSIAKQ